MTNVSSDARNALRKKLIGDRHVPDSKIVTLFDCEIELRQPSLAAILDARQDADESTRTTDVFLKYAYVPGTDEHIFEEADRETILNWPFNEELMNVQTTIAELTGINLADAEEDMKDDPLEESS